MLHHSITIRPTSTPHVLATAALFGLPLEHGMQHTIITPSAMPPLAPGSVVLVTGPSGSGKSTLLRVMMQHIGEHTPRRTIIDLRTLDDLSDCDASLVDVFADQTLQQTIARLSCVGLADAFVMLRRPRELSDGQRMRLRLAQAMHGAQACSGRCVIVADEFAATLDRLTARTISRNLARWIRRTSHTLIVATTHDDLLDALQPDVLIHKPLSAGLEMHIDCNSKVSAERSNQTRTADLPDDDMRIEPGTMADYQQLARFHYRPGRPGPVAGVDVIVRHRPTTVGSHVHRRAVEREVLGVLVRSMPVLSCHLRNIATHGRYTGMDRSLAARLLNREVRTISRVIIDPRCRGIGLAVSLVRYALTHARTPYIEAMAAMGRASPFFERAGMTRFDRPPLPRDARLLDALHACSMQPCDLVDPRTVQRVIDTADRDVRLLKHELQRWAGHTCTLHAAIQRAAAGLLSQPVYYLWRHAADHTPGHRPGSRPGYRPACGSHDSTELPA